MLPVGAAQPISVDLRLITATHRDVDELVKQGAFRHDLLARIDGVRLDLPPPRDRPEDVPLVRRTPNAFVASMTVLPFQLGRAFATS